MNYKFGKEKWSSLLVHGKKIKNNKNGPKKMVHSFKSITYVAGFDILFCFHHKIKKISFQMKTWPFIAILGLMVDQNLAGS